MIAETVKEFATEILRPAAYDADAAATAPEEIVKRSAELGITMINVPEELDGAATERGVVTNALVAEAMPTATWVSRCRCSPRAVWPPR